MIELCILQDNVAHSSAAGAGIISEKLNKGTVDSDCNYVPNFYMWRNFDFGIYLQVRNLHKNKGRKKFELSRHSSVAPEENFGERVMAYSHCRIQITILIQRWIVVLCRNFQLALIRIEKPFK